MRSEKAEAKKEVNLLLIEEERLQDLNLHFLRLKAGTSNF